MNDTVLEIKNLSLIKNDFVIFDDINFSLERGSYMAIIGPNGSGKTSLLKTIIGLIAQTKGEILIEGTSNKNLSADKIAYVPQIKTLDRTFPALAIELVLSGFKHKWSWNISKIDRNLALEYLDRVNALHLADRKLAELSGGELQRIYLARSLAKKPVILLLDEPATGIDLVCEQSINTILNEYNKIKNLPYNFSLSTGISVHNSKTVYSVQDLLDLADKHMYNQKRTRQHRLPVFSSQSRISKKLLSESFI